MENIKLTELEHVKPADIEKRSFEIISSELTNMGISLEEKNAPFIMRAIHTTADFDYAETLKFSNGAVDILKSLIKSGANLVTDTRMAFSGINKKAALENNCQVYSYIDDLDLAKEAKNLGVTRSSLCMKKGMELDGPVIFVVGNAPTALVTIRELFDAGIYKPAFVIGVPVGFVNVVQSKEMIMETDIPYIVNQGRKGGSNVAAALVNAALYEIRKENQ